MFDLTKYKYLRPKKDNMIGWIGQAQIFLLEAELEYSLNTNTLYQIIEQSENIKQYNVCNNYKILDLRTMDYYYLLILETHTKKYIETIFNLY